MSLRQLVARTIRRLLPLYLARQVESELKIVSQIVLPPKGFEIFVQRLDAVSQESPVFQTID